jgi:hypothetical protein
MTDSLVDWVLQTLNPSKEGWLKLSPSMFIAKSTCSLSFNPSVVLLTLASNWPKVLENLTVLKLNIFHLLFNLIFPFIYFILCFITVFYSPTWITNLSPFVLVFLLLLGIYFIEFSFSSLFTASKRFSNRCLEIPPGFGLVFADLGLSSLFFLLSLSCPCHRPCRPSYPYLSCPDLVFVFVFVLFFILSFCRP